MMRVGILLDWANPNIVEMMHVLTRRGVELDLIYPEKQVIDLSTVKVENDLYLIKSGTDAAMSMAGTLDALGAVTLNPYPTVVKLRNKFVTMRVLQAAKIPIPQTFMVNEIESLIPLLDSGPLIIKPYTGSRGLGIKIVDDPQMLSKVVTKRPILAQRYMKPDGLDHKIFNIGGQLFGVRRMFPLRSYEDKIGELFKVSGELEEITLRCGQAFGIDLFCMDIIFNNGKPYVVDVNKFGSYMGVPDAPTLLADYIYSRCKQVLNGELVLSGVKN
jgi:ribosomal protein S6--L-glutamate ligase